MRLAFWRAGMVKAAVQRAIANRPAPAVSYKPAPAAGSESGDWSDTAGIGRDDNPSMTATAIGSPFDESDLSISNLRFSSAAANACSFSGRAPLVFLIFDGFAPAPVADE